MKNPTKEELLDIVETMMESIATMAYVVPAARTMALTAKVQHGYLAEDNPNLLEYCMRIGKEVIGRPIPDSAFEELREDAENAQKRLSQAVEAVKNVSENASDTETDKNLLN